ncbi:MAG: helicase-exonuclease AddAB subunit AddA, partial [Lachnospiraceae bacterium]|nr:helicase-exonuclease AddAB subunit AddA [Lachnospiraceae bacterium]
SYSREDSLCQRIDLHKNFRSRPEVLASVNDLFGQIMGEQLGGVEYDEEAALYPGAVFPEPPKAGISKAEMAEAKLPETPISDSDAPYSFSYNTEYLVIGKDDASPFSAREQEALVIAGKIKALYRRFQVTDKETGKLRPVRYSDMVILLRTTAGWAEEFKGVLEREGIPAYVSSRTGYFQAAEIKALLQLLRVIDNPLQDIPLYGALKSFFGGFSEEEIARIRNGGEEICAEEGEEDKKPENGNGKERVKKLLY